MKRTRNLLIAAAAAAGLLTAAAPAANAASPSPLLLPAAGWPVPAATGVRPVAAACSLVGGGDAQGGTAGVENVICQGSGLVFVGPAVGQIATVIGPTIIGPAVVGSLVVSAGNGAGVG